MVDWKIIVVFDDCWLIINCLFFQEFSGVPQPLTGIQTPMKDLKDIKFPFQVNHPLSYTQNKICLSTIIAL